MPAPRTGQSPKPPSWSEWKAQHQQKPWYQRYPLAVEWFLEHVNDRLHRWAFVEFLEQVGKFTVLIAVGFWVSETDDRAKERHYRAWELINSARGLSGDGGRRDALEDLSKDGVSLAAAPLEEAWLRGIDLRGASLEGANLARANLEGANFDGANLEGANLSIFVNLKLQPDDFLREIEVLREIGVQANKGGANLQRASFRGANLQRTLLLYASFHGADLRNAHLEGANLREVEGLTQEQLDSALGNEHTLLPKHLTRPAHWPSSKSEEPIE